MKYAIWDLDNCLADDAHRIPLIAWAHDDPGRRYAAYHALCHEDEPGNLAVFRAFASLDIRPIFMTGRPLVVEAQTRDWIARHLGVEDYILIMRNNHDHRPSVAVKREMVEWLWHYDVDIHSIVAAFDDRRDIVEMYRWEWFIDSSQLAIHDACAYTNPFNHKER